MRQPLEGVRVIDISRLEIAGITTQHLADLGADVIKFEPLGPGEEIRQYVPRLGSDSAFAVSSFRNKRSVQADLKTEAGKQIIYDLVKGADVFVEVSRRGVMERLGLDYETLRTLNERIVYLSLRAYGNDSPYAMRNSHSPDVDHYAGVASVEPDGEGGLRMVALRNIAAHAGTASATMGVLAALVGVKAHGVGSYVEASMWDAAVTWDCVRATMALNGTDYPGGDQVGSRLTPKHGVYATSDGRAISISTVEPRYWRNFCEAIDRPDLADLAESDGVTDFGSSFEGLYEAVAARIVERSADEWEKLLADHDVPFAIVRSRLEALTGEQAEVRNIVWSMQDRNGETLRTVGRSYLLDGDRGSVRRPVPGPGEHTDEVLGELGYSAERIGELRERRVIG